MKNRIKIIPIAIALLLTSLIVPQFQQVANASSKSPYESGFDHGCDDSDKSYNNRYINEPGKGPSFHTAEFMRGYYAGLLCSDSNDDNDNDNDRKPSNNPYCDQVTVYESCFDRKDYDQETGLYPCKDGSDVEDWRDCDEDNGSNDNDNNDDSNSNDDEEAADEETSNCGGESCTATEKEDSWLDAETEYYG